MLIINTLFVYQAAAVTCQDLLGSRWHLVGEYYGQNSSYRAALRRFNIKNSPVVVSRNMSPREQVTTYFRHIDERYSLAMKDKSVMEELRSEWLSKALISEVPQSYVDHQRALARQNGQGADFDQSFNPTDALSLLQEQQQESFLRWFNYIMGQDINMPSWLRYILLEELLGIGTYNVNTGKFAERTNETVGPYPNLNSEAFTLVYASLSNYYKGDFKNLALDLLDLIQKNERRAFSNIYALKLNELNELGSNFDPKVTEGRWIKYEKGNARHAQELFDSLQNQNTGWCTATTCSTANSQVAGGDFYVYYSRDFNGQYTVPRIAIRMNNNQIGEVRGRAADQNLDSEITSTSILEDKLNDFGTEGERYRIRVKHMRRLTDIENRVNNKEELSRDDLRFLYEIDEKIQGFGYNKDPRIKEILQGRDLRADISFVLRIKPNQVSLTKEEALSGGIIYHYGDLDLGSLRSAEGLTLPQSVKGDLYLTSLTNAKGLTLPQSIRGDLNLNSLTSAEDLTLPQSVGGDLNLISLTSAEGLTLPQSVGGGLDLGSLRSAEGLILPQSIGGDLYLTSLTNAKGLTLPQSIGGGLGLSSLRSAKGLTLPQSIGGGLDLNSLTNAKGLTLPQSIGGQYYGPDIYK